MVGSGCTEPSFLVQHCATNRLLKLSSSSSSRLRWPLKDSTSGFCHSGGAYGYRRVRAELRLGRQIVVSRKLVHKLMGELALKGLPARKQRRSLANVSTAEDLVCRDLTRDAPNQL